jgi:hypothetical protein
MPLNHFRLSLVAAALLLPSCAVTQAEPNSTPSPPSPFLVTLHVANAPGKDYFDLDNPNSSFDVTLKNITNVPQKVWVDWLPPGYYAVALHITAINGQVLSAPFIVGKELCGWAANTPKTEMVYPNEEIERRILVSDLPPCYWVAHNNNNAIRFSVHDNRLASGPRLPRLSGANSSRFETITAYATFSTLGMFNISASGGNAYNARYGVWSGQATSAPVTFKTGL